MFLRFISINLSVSEYFKIGDVVQQNPDWLIFYHINITYFDCRTVWPIRLWPKDAMANSHNGQVEILGREKWGESRRKDLGSNSRVK